MNPRYDDVMLGSIELFCLAAQMESFKRAAAAARVSPPAVSRSVKRLEERMGVRLFERSTRQVKLTDAGRSYLQECRQALDQLAEAAARLSGHQSEPAGVVRITMPTGWAHFQILPLLPDFQQRYPQVQVHIELNNSNADLVAQGFDLAIRGRQLRDSGLVARPLRDAALIVVASPAYLGKHGMPQAPADLAQHNCITAELPSTGQAMPWVFRVNGVDHERAVHGTFRCSGDLLGMLTLARNGAGLAQVYRMFVEESLRSGELVEVLPDFAGCTRPFSLVYPQARHIPLRVRVFVDFLLEHIRPGQEGAPPFG